MWLRRLFIVWLLTFGALYAVAQKTRTVYMGLNTGIISAYTFDQGVNNDQRYSTKYDLKFAPIGVTMGIDYPRFGAMITPGIVNIGQNYFVVNTTGREEGIQKNNLTYFSLPVAAKFYLIDLTFFKVSAVTGGAAAFLLNGRQFVTHDAATLRFPAEVYPILPPGYTPTADGIATPKVARYEMATKEDFRTTQLFMQLGIRSDWNASEDWRVSFDLRVNFGLLDPRTSEYIQRINADQALYSLAGSRHDFFAQLSVGVSRYVEFKPKQKAKEKKHFRAKNYRRPAPRKKPKR